MMYDVIGWTLAAELQPDWVTHALEVEVTHNPFILSADDVTTISSLRRPTQMRRVRLTN